MQIIFATDVAIAYAAKAGTLKVDVRSNRFGEDCWYISDHSGLITVALSEHEADEIIQRAIAR